MKMNENMPASVRERLDLVIEQSNEDCVDNLRWCLVGDQESEGAYEDAKDRGCCGAHDEEWTDLATGLEYRIGFNYGH